MIYCANLGNVLAYIFFSEKIFSYKFEVRQLTVDDSRLSTQFINESNLNLAPISNIQVSSTNLRIEELGKDKNISEHFNFKTIKNVHNNINQEDEVRRIYEKGGEIRNLAGETIWRIFIKGKYFPGLTNSRSLGDLIGREIGVVSEPHIAKYQCDEKFNYYLILCTDGISNNVPIDKMVSIIESNDLCKIINL